jgi:hypothetical protein
MYGTILKKNKNSSGTFNINILIDKEVNKIYFGEDKNLIWENNISKNNYYENDICEIHNQNMIKENIDIKFVGEYKPTDTEMEYLGLMITYFPNSNDPKRVGVLVCDEKYSEEYVCNECNKERDKYKNILGL